MRPPANLPPEALLLGQVPSTHPSRGYGCLCSRECSLRLIPTHPLTHPQVMHDQPPPTTLVLFLCCPLAFHLCAAAFSLVQGARRGPRLQPRAGAPPLHACRCRTALALFQQLPFHLRTMALIPLRRSLIARISCEGHTPM